MSSISLGKRKEREEHAETIENIETTTHGSTLFVSNLPYTATSVDLQTLFSDFAPVRSAFVVTGQGTGISKGVGYVSFAIKEDAESTLAKVSEEGLLLAGRKLRLQWPDQKSKDMTISGTAQKPKPRPLRTQETCIPKDPLAIRTIVVSGLPPAINSKVLWKKFRKYEGAQDVQWPIKKDGVEDPTTAHVLFSNPNTALNAVTKLHAHIYKGSLLTVELKKRLDTLKKSQKEIPAENEKTSIEKPAIRDKAVSRDQPVSDNKTASEDESTSEDGEDEDEDGSDAIGVHEEDDSSQNGDPSSEKDDDTNMEDIPIKPQLPPPETGTTLFIRNLPFAATEEELRTLFRTYGPLRYARITMDRDTGRSRGTGFACFWNKEDADKVIEQSELLRVETMGNAPQLKKNPFKLPSILTPDPSSSLAQSLVLHGRTLDVVRAVTRDEAGKLKEVGEKMREKADKRGLYLLREGVILPNTVAAEILTPTDVERRTSSFNARRALLKSNPSLFISRTRLSVRQIPVFVTERMLKHMALHAVKAFKEEVKKGIRKELTEDELEERPDMNAAEPEDASSKKAGKRKTGLKQTKIVRQPERIDPVTGKGKSKGYGFVEMHTHADALRFLRWANNSPEAGGLFESWWKDELKDLIKLEKAKPQETRDDARLKRMKEELENGGPKKAKGTLIVEFSIENIQVVQRRNTMQKDTTNSTKSAEELGKKRKERKSSHVKGDNDEPSPKKRRVSTKSSHAKSNDDEPSPKKRRASTSTSPGAKVEGTRPGSGIGSIIGRKRKERKKGKGGH